ncbi:accessory Sec system protein translocase subunit SecY2 [Lactococcus muris]|uniref:Accessory Sec system protein translocase subunit SecY2 n=1 Tax=Lactococcus muris TaxID=2941330 RepID=A0ABV4D7U9_9LACT|nr:accessory Sec system protein translocase subunit SecY2 [Lactococcus garvieae]
MFLKLQKKWRSALIFPKLLWSLVIVLVYMFGQQIPVPTVILNTEALAKIVDIQLLNNVASVTGAQLSSINLFSLGLSPWMTAMIIWRFITMMGYFKNATSKQLNRYRLFLTLGIALIQSFGLTAASSYNRLALDTAQESTLRLFTMLIMTAGSFVLIWLGNFNAQKGLGGMMLIILVNMALAFKDNIGAYFSENQFSSLGLMLSLLIFLSTYFLLVLLTVVLYRAEYRIPIRRIGINNAYNKESYLPIRVTPAGALPFMYGMTLMMLPPFILSGLLSIFPNNPTIISLVTQIGISKPLGVGIYAVILYILAIGFAYYNYDAYDIAKGMRQNGDYIDFVRPGDETRRFIQSKVNLLAQFGAWMVLLLGACPLAVVVLTQQGNSDNISIALLVSNAYIVSTLMLGIIEQVNMLQNWKNYKNII